MAKRAPVVDLYAGLAVGDVFVVPLEPVTPSAPVPQTGTPWDGRAGLCRILAREPELTTLRIATSKWIGQIADAADAVAHDPTVRDILFITHHRQSFPHVYRTGQPLPGRFVKVGSLAPTPAELALRVRFEAWEYSPLRIRGQWEWDHDRAGVLARDRAGLAEARADLAKARRAAVAAAKKTARRPPVDEEQAGRALAKLARKRYFTEWRGNVKKPALDASRAIVLGLITNARAKTRSGRRDLALLAAAARAFNKLHAQHDFIFTIEAEAIHEALVAVGEACGLDADGCESTIDEARDW